MFIILNILVRWKGYKRSTGTEGQGTDQYDSETSSDIFIGPAAEGDFMKLQMDFYWKYGEHKELSQCVCEAMHTSFPIASTRDIVSKLPTGDGEIMEPNTFKRKFVDPVLGPI